MDWFWLACGLGLLVLGAEALVRGGVGLARRFRVSPLLIGVTVVAWGTSTPELVVSVEAAIEGLDGIAVGNIVGSNIANILLILAAAAVISPIAVRPEAIRRDGLFVLGATALFLAIALTTDRLRWWHGVLCLGLLAGTAVLTYRQERLGGTASGALHAAEAEEVQAVPLNPWLAGAMVAGGIGLLVLGGELMIGAAVSIARGFGVSEVVIGLTLVAIGTSLPELVTSVIAALRRHSDIALGNILGSNIYNILGILGAASLIAPAAIPPEIARTEMWVMAGATLLLLPAMVSGRIGRALGAAMLTGYALNLWRLVATA
ncbi:calcium/sodium antiporter [Elioraea sp. Yellowstone]|jgi:cation:H+ antiporter|uniref:calcium/sodium antiporter n=1 Tax=Elioraea sp. Yellowstone TaxID=2592070 RepID=UPI00115079F5|nr:calcium/sodium antiporter [Elioraea sp. Yellowstone]TQF78030.1 calcium/sodium antiporter [Elioraea sp. Yellowstone]